MINWLSFAIIAVDSLLLLVYSYMVKRKSGFAANLLMGILTGTAFIYGQATVSGTVNLISLSLYPIAFGTIGGNVLRDILSMEGDSKVGYPTLATENRSYQRCKSRRHILSFHRVACTSTGVASFHRSLYLVLSAVDSSMECTVNLLLYTFVHVKFNHSKYTQV